MRALTFLVVFSLLCACSKGANSAASGGASGAADVTASPVASAVASVAISPAASPSDSTPGSASPAAPSPVGSDTPAAAPSDAAGASPESAVIVPATAATANGGLSDAEIRYGVAPQRVPDVTYQPDVVIPDGGAGAVRSVSSDGLTWTIDANAPHASDLAVGKIFFITGRGVGRVLAMTKNGDDLAVTLGPVEITDVIEEAHLSGENVPLDPSTMFSYSAADLPGATAETDKLVMVAPQIHTAGDAGSLAPPVEFAGLLGTTGQGPPASTGSAGYTLNPFCCGGLGVKVAHTSDTDVNVLASITLQLGKPYVSYKLDIVGGKVVTAVVILGGMAGVNIHFQAGTAPHSHGNVHKQFDVPVDLSFPILGAHVPIALTVQQQFILKTGFSGRLSTLSADGNFSFDGALNAGYQNGSWGITAPENYATVNDPIAGVTGVSLGTSAVEVAYEGRIIVGIGAFGFVTGPFVGFDTAYGVTRGSDNSNSLVGAPACVAVNLKTDARAGIGYSMPKQITSAINSILRALNAGPIAGKGGPSYSTTIKTFKGSLPKNCA